ncbi:MAG: hypothetical protein P8Y18_05900 [Candidatus Bathyarchaeota archaeon]
MKKSVNNKSKNRFFSVFLLPAIIPLWIIGWILSRTESLKTFSTISFKHSRNTNVKNKSNNLEQLCDQ